MAWNNVIGIGGWLAQRYATPGARNAIGRRYTRELGRFARLEAGCFNAEARRGGVAQRKADHDQLTRWMNPLLIFSALRVLTEVFS